MEQSGKHFNNNKEFRLLDALREAMAAAPAELRPAMNFEARIDTDMVSIPVKRFEELIQAEAELRVLDRAYQHSSYSCDMENAACWVFGPKQKKEEPNA